MKKVILCMMFLTLVIVAGAQNTAYVKVSAHGSFERIEKVSSGGYITVGFDSVYKIEVTRWNDAFSPLWHYKLTDANITPIQPAIAEAADGSFYLMTASTEHTGSTLIIKFSSTGSILWQKIYYLASGNMNSYAFSKAAGSDNGFIFGGGQCTLYNYVIKCDQDGNIEWQKQYYYPLSTGVITCWSIIPEGTNYVISSGYNINSLLTFRIDATGNVLAHTAYTYTGMQIVPTRIIKLDQTGGYAIMGNYNSSNDNKTEFIAIYNQALSLLSFNELTVTYTQFVLEDVTTVNNGRNIVAVGSIYDNSVFYEAMINLSNSGNVVWKKLGAGNTGGNTNCEFRTVTRQGNQIICGGSGMNEGRVVAIADTNGNGLCNTVNFDLTNVHRTLTLQSSTIAPAASSALSATVNYAYNNSGSFTKYLYCGSLSGTENNYGAPPIATWPNPVQDKIFIEFPENWPDGNIRITISDINGREVSHYSLTNSDGTHELPAGDLSNGIYILRMEAANGLSASCKLVVSKAY